MSTLQKGAIAPEFTLNDKNGTPHSLRAVKSKYTVIFFYPKDDTPGCTIEAKEMSAAINAFAKAGAAVVGISGGDDRSKEKFCSKFNLKVTLLSDSDFSVSSAYGVYGEKMFMGRTFLGILRTTFLLDAQKRVLRVFGSVKPEGHAAELLAAVREIETGGAAVEDEATRVVSPKRRVQRKVVVKRAAAERAVVKKAATRAPKKVVKNSAKKGVKGAAKKTVKKTVTKTAKKTTKKTTKNSATKGVRRKK